MTNASFSFNGVRKDFIFCEENGREQSVFAPLTRNLLTFPGMPGALLESTETQIRVIRQKVFYHGLNGQDLRKLEEELAAWLVTEEAAPLIFDDENDRVYYVAVDGSFNIEESLKIGEGTITFICPDPYKYGPEKKINGPFQEVSKVDSSGKVSGSTVENPHLVKWEDGASSLLSPSANWGGELTTSSYELISRLDGNVEQTIRNITGRIAQNLFSFNLIAHIERKYGLIPAKDTADKAVWLKGNITKIIVNWYGRGSSPSGNNSVIEAWSDNDGRYWISAIQENSDVLSKLSYTYDLIERPNEANFISNDGFLHVIAHTDPSDGITASYIATDYIELEIDAKIPYLPLTMINEGSAETYPVIKAEVLKPVTVLDIVTEDSYMRIGRPVDLSEVVFTEKELLLKDTLASTVGWTNGTAIDGGVVTGTMVSDGDTFVVSSYGSGSEWHGPALKKSLPQGIQNYRIEFWLEFKPVPGTTGRVELYLLDAAGAKIGKLTLRDTWKNSTIVVSDIEVAGKILDSGPFEQDRLAWNDFYGLMVIEKKGNVFSFYTTELDPETGRHYNARGKTYTDYEGVLIQSLAALQIHAGQYGTESPVSLKIRDLNVYKINLPGSNQIPYIANTGDIIEIDHNTDDIRINGESRIDLKDFGASYFPLRKGENKLTFLPFDAFKTEISYRERYK